MLDFLINQLIGLSIVLSFLFTIKLFIDFKSYQTRSTHWNPSWLVPAAVVASLSYGLSALNRFETLNSKNLAHASTKTEIILCEAPGVHDLNWILEKRP